MTYQKEQVRELLKSRRKELGFTMKELAEKVGVSEATISRWESGDIANMKRNRIAKLSDALEISPAAIMGWYDDNPVSPIYEVAAGSGRICSAPTGTMNIQLRDDQFLATVKGRSMEPTLFDGDTVVIDRQSVPDQDGQIVMVKVDGEENTLKRVQIVENGITLIADNPSVFPTKFYTAEQVKDLPVQIMGVVTKLIRDI